MRALRGASGEAARNEGASPRENERLHWFLTENEPPGTLAPEHFHWLTGIVMTFRFQRAVIDLSLRNLRWTEIHAHQLICRHKQTKPTLYFFKNVCVKDTLGGIIREKEPDDAFFSPSLEYRREIKLPE